MASRRMCSRPKVRTSYLGLLVVKDGTSNTITNCILELLSQWNLDIGKMMGFGSDGASVMVGASNGVASKLKASKKAETKATCKMMDEIVNRVATYFSKSTLRQGRLREMQEALEYSHLNVLGIVKTRWLSRHGAIARICDAYEPLMSTLREERDATSIYVSLKPFKVVYILHFLADILQITSSLSLEFQKDFVDVTMVGGLTTVRIMEIEENFLQHATVDLNGFERDSKNYPIIPDYGGNKGMLAALRGAVKGDMYRSVQMERDINGEDLTEAIDFQSLFARALIKTLKERLQDSATLSAMKMLVPASIPVGSIAERKLAGLEEVRTLGEFYGVEKKVGDKVFAPIVNKEKLLEEYGMFKRQATTEWLGRGFLDTWSMINCNDVWKGKFPELLKIAMIGLVQCSSTAACERGFSRLNIIKNKYRNRLKRDGVDALIRVALEGPELEDYDFNSSILMWKESKDYRHIYTGIPREEREVLVDED